MKKTLSAMLVTALTIGATLTPVLAETTYKVYNSTANKTYTTTLGTLGIGNNEYLWGFFTKEGKPLCLANVNNINIKNGLAGGQCIDINAIENGSFEKSGHSNKYKYGWRENTAGSLQRDMSYLKKERAANGWHEAQGN